MSFNEENFPDLPITWLQVKVGDVHSSMSNHEKLKTQDYLVEGKYPVVDQGGKFVGGYSNDTEKLISNNNPVIVFGDHTRNLKFVNFPFIAGADGLSRGQFGGAGEKVANGERLSGAPEQIDQCRFYRI